MRYQKTVFALILSIALAGMTTVQAQPGNGNGQRDHEPRGQQKRGPATPRPISPAPGTCLSAPVYGGYLWVTGYTITSCQVSESSPTDNLRTQTVRVVGY